tara:strand:- start:1066 stop:1254 length:189 start_codon:yes stop_codon:yes gene_type:complete
MVWFGALGLCVRHEKRALLTRYRTKEAQTSNPAFNDFQIAASEAAWAPAYKETTAQQGLVLS